MRPRAAASDAVPPCKLQRATAAAIEACDGIDGVIEDPARCAFDPKTLLGKLAGNCGAFTDKDAEVISKLLEGPARGRQVDLAWPTLGNRHGGADHGTVIEQGMPALFAFFNNHVRK